MDVRTAWVSDLHLGTRACHAQEFIAFLEEVRMERLFLVGDIIDLEALDRQRHWPEAHQVALRRLLALPRQGCEVTYVPGNHDDAFRPHCGSRRRGVRIQWEAACDALDGRRILMRHGDEVDPTLRTPCPLTRFSDRVYDALLDMDRPIHRVQRALGLERWSVATAVKRRVPQIRRFVSYYRVAMSHVAAAAGADGIVCGHIHRPEIAVVDRLWYMNPGDWLEHCTALVEGLDGSFRLLDVDLSHRVRPVQPIAEPAAPQLASA